MAAALNCFVAAALTAEVVICRWLIYNRTQRSTEYYITVVIHRTVLWVCAVGITHE